MKTTIFYDYFEGQKVPIWFVVKLNGLINWDDEYVYLPVQAPFELQGREDFDPDMLSVTVTMGDLTRHIDKDNTIGVYLPRIKKTVNQFGGHVDEIEQFIFQVVDVEEVLQFAAVRDQFEW